MIERSDDQPSIPNRIDAAVCARTASAAQRYAQQFLGPLLEEKVIEHAHLTVGISDTALARNIMLTHARRDCANCEYVLILDDDIEVTSSTVRDLVAELEDRDLDAISGRYAVKNQPDVLAGAVDDGLVLFGLGCFLLRYAALDALVSSSTTLEMLNEKGESEELRVVVQSGPRGRVWEGEDYNFCRRLHQAHRLGLSHKVAVAHYDWTARLKTILTPGIDLRPLWKGEKHKTPARVPASSRRV